jgi:hypothetical protein
MTLGIFDKTLITNGLILAGHFGLSDAQRYAVG